MSDRKRNNLVTIRLSDAERQDAERLAKSTGEENMSQFFRALLREKLAQAAKRKERPSL